MRSFMSATALLAGLFICVSAAAVHAQEPPAPKVAMSVTLPNGQVEQLTTHESGLATLKVGSREYGFRPTMHDDSGTRMTITVFDMGSPTETVRELSGVEVRGGGPAVATKSTPAFKVQARKAVSARTT